MNQIFRMKGSAGAIAITLCSFNAPAMAQDVAAPQPRAEQAQDDGAIVVTARRR